MKVQRLEKQTEIGPLEPFPKPTGEFYYRADFDADLECFPRSAEAKTAEALPAALAQLLKTHSDRVRAEASVALAVVEAMESDDDDTYAPSRETAARLARWVIDELWMQRAALDELAQFLGDPKAAIAGTGGGERAEQPEVPL